MKCLVLSILVLICATVDGLLCIDREDPLETLLFNVSPDEFVKSVHNLSSIEVGNDDLCRVKFEIYVDMGWLSKISFSKHLSDSEVVDNEVQYETYWMPRETESMIIINFLEYACSEDNCDKQFIVDHIGWLSTATHSQLAMNIIKLIKDDKKKPGNNLKIIIEKNECFIF
jgi:hypothetical protein